MDTEFQKVLEEVAKNNTLSTAVVAQKWKAYCADCQNYDQSPTIEEFLRWNKLDKPKSGSIAKAS